MPEVIMNCGCIVHVTASRAVTYIFRLCQKHFDEMGNTDLRIVLGQEISKEAPKRKSKK